MSKRETIQRVRNSILKKSLPEWEVQYTTEGSFGWELGNLTVQAGGSYDAAVLAIANYRDAESVRVRRTDHQEMEGGQGQTWWEFTKRPDGHLPDGWRSYHIQTVEAAIAVGDLKEKETA